MSVSIRNFVRLAAVTVGLVLASHANAGSVTIDAGGACTGFTWDGSKLTCQVTTDCVISGSTTGTPGSNVVLTASCPTSTTYTWTGGNCATVTTNSCTATEATAVGNVIYGVTGNNSAQDSHTVNWTNTATAPGGCSLSASPSSGGPAATNITLTATCTQGTTPIQLGWTGTGTSNCPTSMAGLSTTCPVSGVSANTTYSVNFSNSAGNTSKTASFTYTAGGGGGNFAGCPGGTVTIDNTWGQTAIDTADYGAFDGNMVSIRVNVPSTATGTTLRTTSWVEFGAGPVVREAIFSKNACDFTNTNALKTSLGSVFRSLDTLRFSFVYRIGTATTSAAGLTPGTAYYINMRNLNSAGQPTCGTGDCRMRGSVPN